MTFLRLVPVLFIVALEPWRPTLPKSSKTPSGGVFTWIGQACFASWETNIGGHKMAADIAQSSVSQHCLAGLCASNSWMTKFEFQLVLMMQMMLVALPWICPLPHSQTCFISFSQVWPFVSSSIRFLPDVPVMFNFISKDAFFLRPAPVVLTMCTQVSNLAFDSKWKLPPLL